MIKNLLFIFSCTIGSLSFLSAQIPMDNLVGYYTFSNASVDDFSGNENHLSDYNMALLRGDDRFGNFIESIVFLDTWIASVDSTMFNFSGDESVFSISLWCKPDSIPPEWFGLINNWSGFDQGGYFLGINPANNRIRFNLNMGTLPFMESSSTFNQNEWMHIVATYDGSAGNLYINGVLESTEIYNLPIPQSSDPFFIARQADQAQAFYYGSMDELLVYDRAITEEEVEQIFTRLPSSLANINTNNALKISPNPCLNNLALEHTTKNVDQVHIYDIRGILIYKAALHKTHKVDVSNLQTGSYYLHVIFDDQSSAVKKFQKR